ncbi:YebC/PmpR family DNA-binding transcriptional regulator [Synechococcus sp. RSCCF101]|uniref:YebC/PmpR family DNA-binding transcriptional regulator n=1 Tax=Synechococcus sp. RSCCF101 TaxID=2511069 RepID=UPI0012472F39|nr:YebC/PmpR family DNA-binding transcriptional regulator [Synechococcus sp. RSCCF101]QEY33164.1 YebC/PmpR family DNA-binding transcriptional regulator [Synechococcus sp. RSCCF101]
MAGHSKWAQIKRTKAVVDARRGVVFTRLAREITVAARGGSDPAGNFQLRTAVTKARAAGVPAANIERAIAKGSGAAGLAGSQLEEVRYEGYGPGGMAVLVEALTDNRNRTAADLRLAFSKNGGNLGESGCVSYLFQQLAVISLASGDAENEPLLELLTRLEAEDVRPADEGLDVIGRPERLQALQEGLQAEGLPVTGWELVWQPLSTVTVDADLEPACLNLLDSLENLDDVRAVSSNLA